jgi:tRNA threonylcarbamoyl adenosine modification protein YeaZ
VTRFFLALETATDVPSFALGSAADPGSAVSIPSRRDLSRDIEGAAAQLLVGRGVAARDLGGVIVADGPGSFTGLRIGIAFAKGLCRAARLPLFAVPSLLGAAWAASGGKGAVLAEYDALRGDVYRAAYDFRAGDAIEVLIPPGLAAARSPVTLPAGFQRASAEHASALALLALSPTSHALLIADPAGWEPAYGRPAEAEARRLARGAR